MINKLRIIIHMLWVKLRHPSIKTNGIHCVRPDTEINIHSGGKLYIGRSVDTQRRVTLSVIGGKLTIGDGTSFNRNDIVVCRDTISIGCNCYFGPNVAIYDHDHKFDRNGTAANEYNTGHIIIENNCWIGANTVILRQTHIGEHCVIGAGTVVKGDIPHHSIVTNNREMIVKEIE